MRRFSRGSASVVGFDEVLCDWTRPCEFTDPVFPFNGIAANDIPHPDVSIRRASKDHGCFDGFAGAVGVIDGVKSFLKEPFGLAARLSIVGLLGFLRTK